MRILHCILVCAFAALAGLAHAQNSYYRSVMPDGRVVVGDKPEPGAKQVTELPLRQGGAVTPGNVNPAAPAVAPQPSAPGLSRSPAPPSSPASSTDDVARAQQAVQDAKKALEAGREPLPGERQGTASGFSRLTDAYFERIK